MFDQWSYHYPSMEGSQASPKKNVKTANRDRALSIAHSVAQATHNPPEPNLRPRAESMSIPSCHTTDILENTKLNLETPFTKKETAFLADTLRWLGSAYSPTVFGFESTSLNHYTHDARRTLLQAQLASDTIGMLQHEAQLILDDIKGTQREFDSIETQMTSLRIQSDASRDDNTRIIELCREVEAQLNIYESLDKSSYTLSQPAPRLVKDYAKFEELVESLNTGLVWCQNHPDFVDIDLYELRFKQSVERALAVAAAYASHELKRSSSRILAKLGSSQTSQALIWTKFRNEIVASKISAVAKLIRTHDKDGKVFHDLERTYFGIRDQLLAQEIARYFKNIHPNSPSFLEGELPTVLAEFRTLYDHERQLYELVFGAPDQLDTAASSSESEFVQWIVVNVCDGLYSGLRRYIVHEQNIVSLCTMLTALQGAAAATGTFSKSSESWRLSSGDVSERDTIYTTYSETEGILDGMGDDKASNGDPIWRQALDPMIRDAQNRLLFRAELEIDTIGRYEPQNAKDFARDRYPPVDRTLKLLEKVYHLLDDHVFNDLAHHCVRECLNALIKGHQSTWLGDSIEAQVWMIGQLIILQSQIIEFDLSHMIEYEIDFSGFQALISSFSSQRSFTDLVQLALTSVPRVVERMLDAMEQVYSELKQAADRLSDAFVEDTCQSLVDTDPLKAVDATRQLRDMVVKSATKLWQLLKKYITDSKSTEVLLDSMQEALIKRYSEYYASLILQPGEEGERFEVMDPESMTAWTQKQFSFQHDQPEE